MQASFCRSLKEIDLSCRYIAEHKNYSINKEKYLINLLSYFLKNIVIIYLRKNIIIAIK